MRDIESRRMLEIGCGPAHLSERLLRRYPSLRIMCLELNPKFIALATRRLDSVRMRALVVRFLLHAF